MRNTNKHAPPTLLIDGDIIAYKAASAVNKTFTFDGDNYIQTASLEEAKIIVDDSLASLLSGFKTTHYVIAMTDAVNWRHNVYPLYKANRKDKPKPLVLSEVKEYMREAFITYQRPTLEADDILGILATSGTQILKDNPQGEKIIVSADKDMKGIPGLFYDLGPQTVTEISEQEANRFHMYQTLIGDVADGYPGCPGIGPVKAERILSEGGSYEEWWPLVVKAYEKVGKLTEDDALVQARISRICRVTDYDYIKKEVKLWEKTMPPSNTMTTNPATT